MKTKKKMEAYCRECNSFFIKKHHSVAYCSDKCRKIAKKRQKKLDNQRMRTKAKRSKDENFKVDPYYLSRGNPNKIWQSSNFGTILN